MLFMLSYHRKAIKATMLLLPLLGITHLLCAIHPPEAQPHFRQTYLIVNAALQSSQVVYLYYNHSSKVLLK